MANIGLDKLKNLAEKGSSVIDKAAVKEKMGQATDLLASKAVDMKDAAISTKEDITDKITELDRMLQEAINEYNEAYTLMNDKGVQLFVERQRAVDSITFVEGLINSIANKPKTFDAEFEEIETERAQFTNACEFADRELAAARKAAGGAGAGLAAAASVGAMGPTVAMWVATTFGTASTGTAISTLSGAAATNAALAWLGGGALAAGGHGMAAGSAFLAMAGPVGWTIAGATLLSSIALFTNKKVKLNKEKNEEIEQVKKNTETLKETDAAINSILQETQALRNGLNQSFMDTLSLYGADYATLDAAAKQKLGSLVNNARSMSKTFQMKIEQ